MMDSVVQGLAVIGGVVSLKVILTFLCSVYAKFLRPGKDLRKYGSWAVVTGATDGIGKAMAFEMASKGLNVVLISRTLSRLEDTKKEILDKYPKVEVQVVAADMGNLTEASKKSIAAELEDKEVGVLVNNVGVSYPFPKYYHELDDATAQSLIDLNMTATCVMTRIVLPGMLSRKKGAVVNISSAAGMKPSPLLAGYSGAKAGIEMMTRALAAEYKGSGIDFQCQVPLFVATKLAKIKKTSLTTPSPASYARSAVRAIGYETTCSPFWAHAVQLDILISLPTFVSNWYLLKLHKGLRARALKKEQQAKKE